MSFQFISILLTFSLWLNLSGSPLWSQEEESLEIVRENFQQHLDLVREPLLKLDAQYESALLTLRDRLREENNLDGLLAVREEVERFQQEKEPPSVLSSQAALAEIQDVYRRSYQAKQQQLAARIQSSQEAYRQKLLQLQTQFTSSGRLDEALEVRDLLAQLENEAGGLAAGLVALYDFEIRSGDTSVEDLSGNGNTGKFVGDARVRSLASERGGYLDLDGKGDFLDCGTGFQLSAELTLAAWVKPERFQNGSNIFNIYRSFSLSFGHDSKKQQIAFYDFNKEVRAAKDIPRDQWTHVAVTKDKEVIKIYLDGVLEAEGKMAEKLQVNSETLKLGAGGLGFYFCGSIDDARIYNRPLSPGEIGQLLKE